RRSDDRRLPAGDVLPPLSPPHANFGQSGPCRAIRVVQSVEALFEPPAAEVPIQHGEHDEPEDSSATWLPAENVQHLFFFRRIRIDPAPLNSYRQPDEDGPLNNTITFIA